MAGSSQEIYTGVQPWISIHAVDTCIIWSRGAGLLSNAGSESGLYQDISESEFVESAIEFEPQFPLWTDGATKRRWLVLPDSGVVDTSDSETWRFPQGTKLFKEFSLGGVRLETRLNLKTEGGWAAVSYVWNEDQQDAQRQLERMENVAGTEHDVPGATECLACHGGRENFSLGFSATQLTPSVRQDLYQRGVLSDAVESDVTVDTISRAGLGVLHGNCSHCHNDERHLQAQATECYAPGTFDTIDFTLPPDLSNVDEAPAIQTARFLLGSPRSSEVLHRMSRRNQSNRRPSMPPLGTEVVDDNGLGAVEAFVEAISNGRDGG